MTEDEFWKLIDTSRAEAGERNVEGQVSILVAAIARLPTEDILSFEQLLAFKGKFSRQLDDARTLRVTYFSWSSPFWPRSKAWN